MPVATWWHRERLGGGRRRWAPPAGGGRSVSEASLAVAAPSRQRRCRQANLENNDTDAGKRGAAAAAHARRRRLGSQARRPLRFPGGRDGVDRARRAPPWREDGWPRRSPCIAAPLALGTRISHGRRFARCSWPLQCRRHGQEQPAVAEVVRTVGQRGVVLLWATHTDRPWPMTTGADGTKTAAHWPLAQTPACGWLRLLRLALLKSCSYWPSFDSPGRFGPLPSHEAVQSTVGPTGASASTPRV